MSRLLHTDADAAPDALTLIHRDHEEVAGLFAIALGDGPAPQRRQAVERILAALTLHAKMEEKLFYPALRAAGKTREKDSVLEAAEEHGLVKDLIAKIKRLKGRDETLKAKLTVLKEIVEHHVREEESEMFDEARRVLGKQLDELGARMQRFKEANGEPKRAPAPRNGSARKNVTESPARKTPVRRGRKKAAR